MSRAKSSGSRGPPAPEARARAGPAPGINLLIAVAVEVVLQRHVGVVRHGGGGDDKLEAVSPKLNGSLSTLEFLDS